MDTGTVTKKENGFVFIQMDLNSACKSCSNKGVCMAGDKPAELKIKNDISLEPGNRVEIDLPPQTKLTAGFLLFIFPIISLTTFYYIFYSVWGTEKSGILGAVIGLIAGIIILTVFSRFASSGDYFKPRSIKKL